MNKISKKIVALVTMAAFVLTLVPMAAFAADAVNPTDNLPVDTNLIFATVDEQTEAVQVGDEVAAQFQVLDNGVGSDIPSDPGVKLWAIDNETKQVTDAVTFALNTADGRKIVRTGGNANVWKVVASNGTTDEAVKNYDKVTVTFSKAGDYTLFAGYGNVAAGSNNANALDGITSLAKSVSGHQVVSVAKENVAVKSFVLYRNGTPITFVDKLGELNLIGDPFQANTSDTCTVGGYAYDKDGKEIVDKDITLTSGNDKVLWFVGDASDGVVKTDNTGYFEFQFKMNDNRNIPVKISADDVTYTLRVIKEASSAYDIDTISDNGYVLAGTDTDNWDSVTNEDGSYTLSDAVQFSIADKAGDAMSGANAIADQPASKVSNDTVGNAHARYLDVTAKPDKSKLNAWDLVLVEDGDNYTLKYIGDDETHDLIPGKYTVTVSLLSGDHAEATFNVAEFGTIKDTVLDLKATDRSSNRKTKITDEVTLGQNVQISAQYVDENGLKIPATGIGYGVQGAAVVDNDVLGGNEFATKDDIAANSSLLGTTIEVTAFSKDNHQLVQKELTVVDSYNSFSLEFDPTNGPVNEDNKVAVKVVKEDGSVAQVRGTLQAYVADQSNEDAIVTVKTVDNGNVSNGKGEIVVYASEPTEVDIVVAVDDATNDGLYAGTLKYTAGDGNIFAHHNVTMTIGSSEYVVDKQLFTMDAAPYVDSNWRTMVPIRALAEAFDADVKWNNDDRTVTIKYNEQTIVMTIGEKDYTINGETATMDTEAVIQGDRTYVPIRFAAEAMGFTVTPLYNENSSTASVVFQS